MLLMIDNYDSFTYNLVQYFLELGEEVKVIRNDKLTLEDIEQLAPERLVISPGPCTPKEAGISLRRFSSLLEKFHSLASVWVIRRSQRPILAKWCGLTG